MEYKQVYSPVHPVPYAELLNEQTEPVMRKLSNTPLQVEVDLLRTKTHEATHVSAGHLETCLLYTSTSAA